MRALLLAVLILSAALLPQRVMAVDPPYEPQMERLAEILGSLYFLNPLCKPGGTDWRSQLSDLVRLDSPTKTGSSGSTARSTTASPPIRGSIGPARRRPPKLWRAC